jgi:uncharacterized protein (UPF0305 family)
LINRCAIRKECHTNEIDNQKRTKYKEGGQKTETLGLAKSIIRETKPISSEIFLNYQDIYTTYTTFPKPDLNNQSNLFPSNFDVIFQFQQYIFS